MTKKAEAKKADVKEPGWLNRTQMAASLGISTQAFEKWGVRPVKRIGRETFYTCSDVVQNRIANWEEKNNKLAPVDGDSDSLDFQRLRLTKEQADNMELKNEQARAKLIPIALLTEIIARVAGEWSTLVDALPLNIKRKHPTLESMIVEDVKRQCVKMQNAVSRIGDVMDEVVRDHADSIDPS